MDTGPENLLSSPPTATAAQLAALQRELSERSRSEAWHVAQERVLEMIATNAPLADTLDLLLRLIEAQAVGLSASVLLLEPDGRHVRLGAAPSLPPEYTRLVVERLRVGPNQGSCGTAMHLKTKVIAGDILNDPVWEPCRAAAEPFGLRACWSAPILTQDEKVLGTFAMYFREPRTPTVNEARLIESATHLARIAIERKLIDDGMQRRVLELTRLRLELDESRQMLRTVVDTVPQRIFWKDRNSAYVGCNQALARDHGFTDPADLIGRTDLDFKPAAVAQLYMDDDRRVMETGQSKLNYEEPFLRPDGSRGWLRTSKVPLHDQDGRVMGVLGTYEDISERKRLEEQFRQSQKMDAFGQLAAGVAHDFNNILTVIQGHLSQLLMGERFEPRTAEALQDAYQAAERASNLTRQLLTFSHRQPFQPAPVDLNQLVVNATKMLQRLIGENIALEARYAPGQLPVQADVGLMEQVLMNLAVNSRDAMPKGGLLVIETGGIELGPGRAVTPKSNGRIGPFAVLTVRDNGMGIPPEHLAQIFEPFFTTKEVGRGTGLGLATVFGIVEQHDGWIEVRSEVGAGTAFDLYFPRLSREVLAAAAPAAAPAARGGSETILLVEDEAAVRRIMRALLERSGYRVHECHSGLEALKAWAQVKGQVDLLVTDMVMPDGVGGRELAEKLQAERPGLKVIYCSGYTDEVLGQDSPLRKGVNFLSKPFDMQKFLQSVRECLDAP